MTAPSAFVVSLDLELYWGLHDQVPPERAAPRMAGVRAAVDGICRLFERYDIHATWAVVGLLMARDRDEALAAAPPVRPAYNDATRDAYRWMDQLPPQEMCFGPELVQRVADTPNQEIGSHTFSHLLCLEPGPTMAQFRADLRAARQISERRGISPVSLVFPRNQFDESHLRVAYEEGFLNVRGTPRAEAYRPRPGRRESPAIRAVRLLDAHLPVVPAESLWCEPRTLPEGPVDVPASRFARPAHRIRPLLQLQLRRVLAEMRQAVQDKRSYHLWWHPHNMAVDLENNLVMLEEILRHAAYLRDRYAWGSYTMAEVGDMVRHAA